jgi:hypothetical protein
VTFERSQPWALYAVPDLRIVIAGLNSTMAETHRPEDGYGELGEAQAAWFDGQLRPYAEQGWLRVAVVAHDPAELRDSPATAQLIGRRVNLLLHGQSGRGPGATADADPSGPWAPALLTVPAGSTGEHEIVHLTVGGVSRWRAGNTTTSQKVTEHTWESATATFPPPPLPGRG